MDIRSDEWRSLLIDKVVPAALAKGYQGFFLDTLDVAQYLETRDPLKYGGSVLAAKYFIKELRTRYPRIYIVVNNALPLVEAAAGDIDGAVVEDLYTRCDPAATHCGPTPAEVSRTKEEALARFHQRTGKPVFVLLYSGLRERGAGWVLKAVRRSLKEGFLPYLAAPALDRLGEIAPQGKAPK